MLLRLGSPNEADQGSSSRMRSSIMGKLSGFGTGVGNGLGIGFGRNKINEKLATAPRRQHSDDMTHSTAQTSQSSQAPSRSFSVDYLEGYFTPDGGYQVVRRTGSVGEQGPCRVQRRSSTGLVTRPPGTHVSSAPSSRRMHRHSSTGGAAGYEPRPKSSHRDTTSDLSGGVQQSRRSMQRHSSSGLDMGYKEAAPSYRHSYSREEGTHRRSSGRKRSGKEDASEIHDKRRSVNAAGSGRSSSRASSDGGPVCSGHSRASSSHNNRGRGSSRSSRNSSSRRDRRKSGRKRSTSNFGKEEDSGFLSKGRSVNDESVCSGISFGSYDMNRGVPRTSSNEGAQERTQRSSLTMFASKKIDRKTGGNSYKYHQ